LPSTFQLIFEKLNIIFLVENGKKTLLK